MCNKVIFYFSEICDYLAYPVVKIHFGVRYRQMNEKLEKFIEQIKLYVLQACEYNLPTSLT